LKSACFFTSFLFFLTFLIGIVFLEPDLHGFRFCLCVRFDGLFWEVSKRKICFEKCIFVTSFSLFYNISSALIILIQIGPGRIMILISPLSAL
jgi:hypothetical protein